MPPNNTWKKAAGLAAGLAFAASTALSQTTLTNVFTVNKAIPDGSASGLSDTQTLDFSAVPQFTTTLNLKVTLNISGGFNGDYYGYLVHNGGFAVLLNRSGRTSVNDAGFSDSGFTITLDDTQPDIHNYQTVSNPNGGTLLGSWAPDGRNVDPASVLDTDSRTSLLSSFNGEDPSGEWTLFLADLDFGEQGQLVSWGLVVTAVPEPSTAGLVLMGLGAMLGVRRLARKRA